MPQGLVHWIVAGLFGLLSLATALFYRALRSASPARLEEINELRRAYSTLPDLDDALLATGWFKVVVYAGFAASVGILVSRTHGDYLLPCLVASAFAGAALLAGEALALVIAGYHSGGLFYRFIPLVMVFAAIGAAALSAGGFVAGIVARVSGWEPPLGREAAAKEEILDAVTEGKREGLIHAQESQMIESIIDFKDIQVSRIMTPRTKVATLSAGIKVLAALQTAVTSGHTRLPVRAESADNIVGVLYVKDILPLVGLPEALGIPVSEIMRAPYFVPETKTIRELLQEFRATNVHMAIVLDEYGGTSGIVTIEDILEEIVGEIEDEYHAAAPPPVRVLGAGKAVVEGHAALDEVNDALGIALTKCDDYETIAGFVLSNVKRIPQAGETFDIEGSRFKIVDADPRRIKRMSIEAIKPAPAVERK
jgi:magnesium and cobalt transporter